MAVNPDLQSRRALLRELRAVSRLLRWSGLALAAIGVAGLLLARPGAWWLGPSWFSLAAGSVLIIAGIVRRVRNRRRPPGTSSGG